MLKRVLMAVYVLVGTGVTGCGWPGSSPSSSQKNASALTVSKESVHFESRTFDPSSPPAGMPPMSSGEVALCDSDFRAIATVGGQPRKTDGTHATLTVSQIKVKLFLVITIWTPAEAAPRIVEHETGHRQISEYYYQTADQVAERIAEGYVGKQLFVEGSDLEAEANKALQQVAAEITEEYKREIDPSRTQLLYDDITDHSRNDTVVKDAVEHAIKNAAIESIPR